ncbi:hypothetical protein GN156_06905 [bacterium LRH843]|nr:hypothetical protein [bacterium LRH843]
MKRWKVCAYVSLVLCISVLVGCGNKLGAHDIHLGGEVIEKKDKIVIEGKSNLLPGARVTGEVFVNEDELFAETTELVDKKGNFQMEMDHHQYGDAEVVVTFNFSGVQDEEIVEHYGEGGENLKGPFVYVTEHWGAVEKQASVRLPLSSNDESEKHEFSVPVWNELPDDYGDPRVWIEVDEVNTDEDYFYLQGRTNLLEGSRIRGSYSNSWNDGSTHVKPDGTFEMKIDYKYSEDPYFLLEFDPSGQWETIREAYGRDGEKLVGKHVETSGNSQYIEVRIDYTHE